MAFQLRFSDATLDADLLDGSPGTLILEPTVRYALCRSMTVRPDGCMPLVVRDPKVSACHFILSFLDGHWRVEDGNGTKRSTNGTLLDGEKIGGKLATLTPGSVLAAQGSMTSLYFEAAPVATTAETSAETTQTFSQEAADSASASRGGSAIEAAAVEDEAVEVVEEAEVEEVPFVEVPEGGGGTASQPEQLNAVAPPPPVGSKLTVWYEDDAGEVRPWVGTMLEKHNRKKEAHMMRVSFDAVKSSKRKEMWVDAFEDEWLPGVQTSRPNKPPMVSAAMAQYDLHMSTKHGVQPSVAPSASPPAPTPRAGDADIVIGVGAKVYEYFGAPYNAWYQGTVTKVGNGSPKLYTIKYSDGTTMDAEERAVRRWLRTQQTKTPARPTTQHTTAPECPFTPPRPTTKHITAPEHPLVVYQQQLPSGECAPLGFVKIARAKSLAALHAEVQRKGLASPLAHGFQFLMPSGEVLLPIWKPQHKNLTISDILLKAPDTGVDECVMVRATPRTLDQDEADGSAFPQAATSAKRKEAGVAKGSAAAEQAGADGTARKVQKKKQRKLPLQQWSPTQVSPATTAGTIPMRRSQFVAAVTPEEVD